MFGANDKDAAFFDSFSTHVQTSVEATKLLLAMLELVPKSAAPGPYRVPSAGATAAPPELAELSKRVEEAEHRGDLITHDVVKRLRKNWITPLDRDDIHTLMSRLDDILDFVKSAAERVVIFEVRAAPPEASEIVEIIQHACETLTRAVGLLSSMKNAPTILELCVEVNRLENAADDVHRRAITEMFRAGNDPLVVMKWRDIFDRLESAVNCCEDAANVIEGVVLEYA